MVHRFFWFSFGLLGLFSMATGTVAAPRKPLHSLNAITAQERADAISELSYHLDFTLDETSSNFHAKAALHFNYSGGLSSELTIDLSEATISSLTLNGKPYKPKEVYNGFFLHFQPNQVNKGANVILIEYSAPYSQNGEGLHRFVDSQDASVYTYTNFEPYYANKVFPCFDQPNLKARFTLRVTAPQSWTVIANLREDSSTLSAEQRVWEFPQTPLMSTYVFAMHAGPYHMWESKAGKTPLRLFARKTLAKYVDAPFWFKTTEDGMKFFEDYFAFPYPFKKYDQLIVPEFTWGGMENIGAVTYSENFIKRGKATDDDLVALANTLLHELSHMWFGNLVTMNWWDDLWLNESFATYMSYQALTKVTKFKSGWRNFHSAMKTWGYNTDALKSRHPIATLAESTDVALSNLDGITYAKGASVVKQLVQIVGESKFRAGIRNYFKNHQYANTKLNDFLSAISTAAKRDLSTFSQEWLQTPGTNTVSTDFSCKDNQLLTLVLKQSATAPDKTLRTHRTNIALYEIKPGGRLAEKVLNAVEYSGPETSVKLPAKLACPSIINTNKDDFDFVNQTFNEKMTAQILTSLAAVSDPLDRMVFVTELWKKVELGELSFKRFSSFALTFLTEEKDPDLNRLVFKYLQRAKLPLPAFAFLASDTEEERKALTEIIKGWEDLAWQKINKSKSLSTRAAALKLFLTIATTETAIQNLLELLNPKPKSELPELMSQDMRWKTLIRLVAVNYPQADALLKKESELDKTSASAQWLLAAKAATPDLKAKRKLFDKINRPKAKVPLEDKKSILRNLFPFGQQDLQRKFADDYYNLLPKVSATADDGYLKLLTTSIVPAFCSSASESRLRKFLEQNAKLPYLAKRNLEDAHEADEACIKVRAAMVVSRPAAVP